MAIPQLVHQFICSWIFELFPVLGYCEYYKYLCGNIFSFLLGKYIKVELLSSMMSMFNLLRKCHLYNFLENAN